MEAIVSKPSIAGDCVAELNPAANDGPAEPKPEADADSSKETNGSGGGDSSFVSLYQSLSSLNRQQLTAHPAPALYNDDCSVINNGKGSRSRSGSNSPRPGAKMGAQVKRGPSQLPGQQPRQPKTQPQALRDQLDREQHVKVLKDQLDEEQKKVQALRKQLRDQNSAHILKQQLYEYQIDHVLKQKLQEQERVQILREKLQTMRSLVQREQPSPQKKLPTIRSSVAREVDVNRPHPTAPMATAVSKLAAAAPSIVGAKKLPIGVRKEAGVMRQVAKNGREAAAKNEPEFDSEEDTDEFSSSSDEDEEKYDDKSEEGTDSDRTVRPSGATKPPPPPLHVTHSFRLRDSSVNTRPFDRTDPDDDRVKSIERACDAEVLLDPTPIRNPATLTRQRRVIIRAPDAARLAKCCRLIDQSFPGFRVSDGLGAEKGSRDGQQSRRRRGGGGGGGSGVSGSSGGNGESEVAGKKRETLAVTQSSSSEH